jgi:hypothetical protein
MRKIKILVMAAGVAGLFLSIGIEAFAGGPAGVGPCCVVTNPGAGALALKGTMALVIDPGNISDSRPPNLDVTLRLERSSALHFFRLNISGINVTGYTDEQLVCLILNPFATADESIRQPVWNFVQEILAAFSPGSTPCDKSLVIRTGSIMKAQGYSECVNDSGVPVNCLIPGTDRISTLGDLTIFTVDQTRVRLAEEYVLECPPDTYLCPPAP